MVLQLNQVLFSVLLLLVTSAPFLKAADAEENRTDTDEAEFRQGGISQQLMSGYPAVMYGAASTGGGSYVNMLRNLYRPPSLGLTDKVKHWVKSFMNRRQYVKPYYAPSSVSGLQYSPDEFGKPVYMNGQSYKAISIPLRQLQKYYKPYYGGGDSTQQFLQSQQASGSASNPILSYGPGSGLYGSEGAFSGSSLFGSSGNSGSSGFFGSSGSSGSNGLFASSGSNGGTGLFGSSGNSGSNGLFSSGHQGGSLLSGSDGGFYSQGGSYLQSDGAGSSALFSANGLYGGSGSSQGGSSGGSTGSSSSNLYPAASGSGSSVYSLDSGALYGSDGGYFGSSSGTGSHSSSGNSALLASLGSGSASSYGGDLYASGASPSATIYNPTNHGEQQQSRGGYGTKKSANSALYMASSDQPRKSESSYGSKEPSNSFNVGSTRNSPVDSSSYSASAFQGNSGFQPVSFMSDFQGKSS